MGGVVFRPATRGRTACPEQDHRPRAEGGAGGSPCGTLGNLRRTLAGDASLAQPYSREESLTRLKAAVAMIEGWHEFYLLVGTSAAALTGLMFVVISISPETIAERPKAGIRDVPPARGRHPQRLGPGDLAVAAAPQVIRSTSFRTFVLYPLVVVGWELLLHDGSLRIEPWFLPLVGWGYLQYRLIGE